jgi:MFS family permease
MTSRLSPTAAYGLAAGVIGLGLYASVTPSPLYRSYSALWHFSPLTLTLVYATYAFAVLATLLLAGRVSDIVGRRPVLVWSLAGLMLSTLLFVAADSTAWLFAARAVQGLSTGAALSAASAALLDLHPRRDPRAVSVANGVASAAGLGAGLLVSSALVQAAVAPRVLPYAVELALAAAALAGALLMPEPAPVTGRFRLTVEMPRVPRSVRGAFVLAGLAVLSSWSIGGLFFSLGPQLGARLFGSSDAVVDAIGIVTLTASAAIAQLFAGRTAPWLGAGLGSIALAAGTLLIVAATASGSSAAYLAGSVVAGLGFGSAFLGGLRQLTASIPAADRAAVMSAFYVVAYASLSVPAVLAGIVVTHLGLQQTFETFGSVVSAVALAVAVQAWRLRPRQPACDAVAEPA